jgi:hypothetical protein
VGDFGHAQNELGDLVIRVVGRDVEPHRAPRLALRRSVLGAESVREAHRLGAGLEVQTNAGRLGVEIDLQPGAVADAPKDRRGEGGPGGAVYRRGPAVLFARGPAAKACAAYGWTTREGQLSERPPAISPVRLRGSRTSS